MLSIFTATYNRAHTLGRLYQSLVSQTCHDVEWLVIDDGSTDDTSILIAELAKSSPFPIRYEYKENGGLYTGYNRAYALAKGELAMAVDSDDFLPANAVELILNRWAKRPSDNFAGIIGLDFNAKTHTPIGGYFPEDLDEVYFYDLHLKHIHRGDTKEALRTDLMRQFIPMVGYPGEKYFNPVYLILQATEHLPLLVINENLCFVEYRPDSMSDNMCKQYLNSPRSFAKERVMEIGYSRNAWWNKLRCYLHLTSHCIIARDFSFRRQVPSQLLFYLLLPLGALLTAYIRIKS